MVDLSGPFVLTVPLVVATAAGFVWLAWARPASPPRFRGYVVRQGWQVDPLAVLELDLRQGHLSAGILEVRDRLWRELSDHHHLTPVDIRRWHLIPPEDWGQAVQEACQHVRALEATLLLASRAEDPRRVDLWSRWRKPAWRARARRRFEQELSEVETLWPRLEAAS
jgi:hypothetical protein